MKKFLAMLMAAVFMPAAVYANVNADKPILIETQDCSEAIKVLKEKFPNGYADTIARHIGRDFVIGTPFAIEYTDGSTNGCFYRFPIISNGVIKGNIDVSEFKHGLDIASSSYDGLIMSGDESCWDELKDGNAYIIHQGDTMRTFATFGDKNVLLSPYYENEKDLPVPVPVEAERTVVDITKPLDIETNVSLNDEEMSLWQYADEMHRPIMVVSADEMGAVIKNDRLLVPLRAIGEAMNCQVEWIAESKTAVVKGEKNVEFIINKPCYKINGEIYNTDVPAEIINGKTYIPMRAVSEALGAGIAYNAESGLITLSY